MLVIVSNSASDGPSRNRNGQATARRMSRFPAATPRATGGDPISAENGAIAAPTLAPSTRARASGSGNTLAAASAITNNIIVRLECIS